MLTLRTETLSDVLLRLRAIASLAREVEGSVLDLGILGRVLTCDRGTPGAVARGLERLLADLQEAVDSAALAALAADSYRSEARPDDQKPCAQKPCAEIIPFRGRP